MQARPKGPEYKGSLATTGAKSGDVVLGCFPLNEGLKLRLHSSQTAGKEHLVGQFTVLEAGNGYHASGLALLEGKTWDRDKAIAEARQKQPTVTHVFTKEFLVLAG